VTHWRLRLGTGFGFEKNPAASKVNAAVMAGYRISVSQKSTEKL
jgi:hypothetical protein